MVEVQSKIRITSPLGSLAQSSLEVRRLWKPASRVGLQILKQKQLACPLRQTSSGWRPPWRSERSPGFQEQLTALFRPPPPPPSSSACCFPSPSPLTGYPSLSAASEPHPAGPPPSHPLTVSQAAARRKPTPSRHPGPVDVMSSYGGQDPARP